MMMTLRKLSFIWGVSLIGALVVPSAQIQAQDPPGLTKPLTSPGRALGRYADALGSRTQSSGKERMSLTGTLNQAGKSKQATLLYELSGQFRLDAQGNSSIGFDGNQAWAKGKSISGDERDLLEALSASSPEGFFAAVSKGSAVRRLGERFRDDDGTTPNYQGPWFNIFQVGGPLLHQGEDELRTRFFYFDSETGYLRRVRYLTRRKGSPTTIEVRFDDWTNAGGDAIPQHITVSYDGSQELEFTATGASFSTRMNDQAFQQ